MYRKGSAKTNCQTANFNSTPTFLVMQEIEFSQVFSQKTNIFTFSGFRELLMGVMTLPEALIIVLQRLHYIVTNQFSKDGIIAMFCILEDFIQSQGLPQINTILNFLLYSFRLQLLFKILTSVFYLTGGRLVSVLLVIEMTVAY